MMRSCYAALMYTVLGLLAGLFFREYTKAHDWPEDKFSQLNVLHTHLLALGLLVMLAVLALDAIFDLSKRTAFTVFFWVYNAGVLITVTMMLVHGIMSVDGTAEKDISPAISGIAGLGHMTLTVGLVAFFVALVPAVREYVAKREGREPDAAALRRAVSDDSDA